MNLLQFMNPDRLSLPLPRSHHPHDRTQKADQNHARSRGEQLPEHVYPCPRGAGQELEEVVDLVQVFLVLDVIILGCRLAGRSIFWSLASMISSILLFMRVVMVRLTQAAWARVVVVVVREWLCICVFALLHHVRV